MNRILYFVTVFGVTLLSSLLPPRAAMAVSTSMVISEVQTAGVQGATHELIELHNNSQVELPLSGWRLEYISASGKTTTTLVDFDETNGLTVAARGFLLLTSNENPLAGEVRFDAGMASSAGHLRLIDGSIVVDTVSWGLVDMTAETVAVEKVAAPAAGTCQSLQRILGDNGLFVDTDDNAADFVATIASHPTDDPACLLTDDERSTGEEPGPPVVASCQLVLSEILANPSGSDIGREYIELHNPTATVQLLVGCKLRQSVTGNVYTILPADDMLPGEYRIFTAGMLSSSGLQLTNSGGEVWLHDDNQEIMTAFPALKDDETWALIDNVWQITNVPTPNAANRPFEDRTAEVAGVATLAPCGAGKYRHPATNRCRNVEIEENQLAPCANRQERNPETNRCRNTVASSTSLTPCKPGQERNPATNRCRSVAAATNLTPCQEGYERNPETNRCRKIAPALAASNIAGSESAEEVQPNYSILGFALIAALGYGAYEYRNDVSNLLYRLRTRREIAKSSK